MQNKLTPPIAKQSSKELTAHNHTRIDNYYWMRDRQNPEVIDYINAENEFCENQQKHNESLRTEIFEEIKGRMKEDDASAPYFSNGYWYYSRFEPGKELAIYCRKKGSLGAEEEILINENIQADNHDYYEVVSMSMSPDNKLLIFAEDLTGRRKYNIRLKNLETGEYRNVPIKNTSSSIVWHNDNATIYFVQKDEETLRPYQLKSFNVVSLTVELLYEEKDEKFTCGISKSKDDEHIILGVYSTLTTEFYHKKSNDYSVFKCFLKRKEKHEYYLDIIGNECFIKSNLEAPNFKLAKCLLNQPNPTNWEIFQDGAADIYIEDFDVFEKYICVLEKSNGLGQLSIYNRANFEKRFVPIEEETYSIYFGINEELNLSYLRVGYTSMTKPSSVYTIDLEKFKVDVD